MRVVLVLVFALSCKQDTAERRPVTEAPPTLATPPVQSDAGLDAGAVLPDPDASLASLVDAGPGEDAQLITAAWPAALEVTMVERKGSSGRHELDVRYPKFVTRPRTLGDDMNARIATHALLDLSTEKGTSGSYQFACKLITVSRIAVIVQCDRMLISHTDEEVAQGTGGAPAGPTPLLYSWWLQPGLPPVAIEQLAPGIDVGRLLATAKQPSIDGCTLQDCALSPKHFIVDDTALTFVPTEYCSGCEDHFPKIPLEQLAPIHPWGIKLVDWMRKRIEAGESLVKYEK